MKTPLKVTISPTHPLLTLMVNPGSSYEDEGRQLVRLWEALDDDIRPYATVQIGGARADGFERARVDLSYAQDAGIPITLQVQGDNGDRRDTMPMETMRRFVDKYSCIVGLEIAEASQRTFADQPAGPEYTMGRNARYARDVIRLAGEYGLFMNWQLMRENYLAIGCSGDNEALFDAICEHRENVIPMHEMNCEFAKLTDHLGAMGLWLSGATAQWGVEGQSWYWHDAGYNAPGTYYPGTTEMPGEVYAIMFLLAASAGACAYAIEPPRDVWKGTTGAWRFDEWIVPTLKRLVKERLIPTREEVIASMPVAYHLPRCRRPMDFHKVLDDLDFDHREGRLIRATCGVYDRAREAEMIPNSPRYGWIPALPTKTPQTVLDEFKRIIRPGDLVSVEQAKELLNEHFPPVDRGEAWSQVVGPLILAANSHENWFVPESVKLAVPRRPTGAAISLEGGRPVLTWQAHPGDEGYRVWRVRDGRETCLTDTPIPETRYVLNDVLESDAHAVSAITSAKEVIEGTLHLHDFLVFSNRESRHSLWVSLAGREEDRPRFAEALRTPRPEVLASEARCAECTLVEDLASPVVAEDDPSKGIKRAVMEAMVAWKEAIEAEDVERILSFYDADYREADGRTAESVGVAFRSIFWRYLKDQHESLAKEWGCIPAWENPVVRLLVRKWGNVTPDRAEVDTVVAMWAGSGPEMEPSDMFMHPWGRPNNLRMVWRRTRAGWRIVETTPAFLRMEDTVPFRLCYQGW